MAVTEGKLLPFRAVRSPHQPHRPHGSHGRAESDNPAGGEHVGGLRQLPSLRTEASPGADGTCPPSSIGGLDLAATRSAGQASSANRGWLSQIGGCWQIAT
jgi:hypothetical protein